MEKDGFTLVTKKKGGKRLSATKQKELIEKNKVIQNSSETPFDTAHFFR